MQTRQANGPLAYTADQQTGRMFLVGSWTRVALCFLSWRRKNMLNVKHYWDHCLWLDGSILLPRLWWWSRWRCVQVHLREDQPLARSEVAFDFRLLYPGWFPQLQRGEISFIVQQVNVCEAIRAKTKHNLTAADLNAIDTHAIDAVAQQPADSDLWLFVHAEFGRRHAAQQPADFDL